MELNILKISYSILHYMKMCWEQHEEHHCAADLTKGGYTLNLAGSCRTLFDPGFTVSSPLGPAPKKSPSCPFTVLAACAASACRLCSFKRGREVGRATGDSSGSFSFSFCFCRFPGPRPFALFSPRLRLGGRSCPSSSSSFLFSSSCAAVRAPPLRAPWLPPSSPSPSPSPSLPPCEVVQISPSFLRSLLL